MSQYPQKTIRPNTPLGTPVLKVSSDTEYHNWDVFQYEGQLWTLGIPRDEDHVELIPEVGIGTVTDVPQSKWEEFDVQEFAELLEAGDIEPKPEESPLRQ